MALIGYARVSTDDQTLDPQIDALTAAGCTRIFRDWGVSGALRERPGLTQALDYVREGDVLVVTKLDRAGRSLRNLQDLIEGLRDRDIGFRSLGEAIDTSTPSGELLLHVLGAIAQFERSLIVSRTKAGLDAARARGRVGGRPVKCTPDKVEAARLLIANGATVSAAAKAVGVSRAALYEHLPVEARATARAARPSR